MSLFEFCGSDAQIDTEKLVSGTPVQITHPRITDFTEYIDLNANTVFLKKEIVRATFQGFIEKINKNIGDKIRQGDLLVIIKTKESSADDSLSLDLGAKMFQGSVKIIAHSSGILTALNYHSGDFVSEGEEIAVISNPSSLKITLNVPYPYVSRINPNSICSIFLPDGRTIPATVQKVIPSIDPESQTQTFLLMPQHSVNLPENLNVNARLSLKTIKNACVLPRNAVLSNETQDKFWVMKVVDNSTAVQVFIRKGIENDSLIQIISPVFNPGDRIIADGGFGLTDSSKVTITK